MCYPVLPSWRRVSSKRIQHGTAPRKLGELSQPPRGQPISQRLPLPRACRRPGVLSATTQKYAILCRRARVPAPKNKSSPGSMGKPMVGHGRQGAWHLHTAGHCPSSVWKPILHGRRTEVRVLVHLTAAWLVWHGLRRYHHLNPATEQHYPHLDPQQASSTIQDEKGMER